MKAKQHTELRMVKRPCSVRLPVDKKHTSICGSVWVTVVFSGQRRKQTKCFLCHAERKGLQLVGGNKPQQLDPPHIVATRLIEHITSKKVVRHV